MSNMFDETANNPSRFTYQLTTKDGEKVVFRPLAHSDVTMLAAFLEGLSPVTRERSTFDSYDMKCAQELCEAINKYDKLRFVCIVGHAASQRIIGLLELSFGIPPSDLKRYREAGINLSEDTDVRFGPTLADDWQGKGLGTMAFEKIVEIVDSCAKKRILLWGGVLESNTPAVKYYKKLGFETVGTFDKDGIRHLDMLYVMP